VVHGTPTDNPGPDQHSPLDRPTPTQGKKRKKKLNNKQQQQKRHVAKRVKNPEYQRGVEGQSLSEL
jgi:hypothetical protein